MNHQTPWPFAPFVTKNNAHAMEHWPEPMADLPQRRMMVLTDHGGPSPVLTEMQRRSWDPVQVHSFAEAKRELDAYPYMVALVTASEWDRSMCQAVRACATSTPNCEWVAVLPRDAVQEPPLRDLILDCFFDYHTDPVDPDFLCRVLGHAFGRALLRNAGGEAETLPAALRAGRLQDVRVQAEKAAVQNALSRSGDNVTVAARELGVSRMTLYRLISKHNVPLRSIS